MPAHADPRPSALRPPLALGALLAACVLLNAQALRTAFFADDYLFLDQVRGRTLLAALGAPDPLSNFFRPVSRQLYFWCVAGLSHESALAFHVGNLLTLLVAIALLYALARRWAGERVASFAAAFLALHYAADVPVRWACGSQELFAVTGALAATLLHVRGHRRWAGLAMLLAALSKEVVLLAPVIAVFADHRPGERWRDGLRRAWPLALAVAVWAALFLALPQRHAGQVRQVAFAPLQGPLAALAHCAQVALGAEWLQGVSWRAAALAWRHALLAPGFLAALLLALGALALAWRRGAAPGPPERRFVIRAGGVWVLVALAPVATVMSLWSAYYFLFALCGVALLAGTWLARVRLRWAALVLAACAVGSAGARALPGFGTGEDRWTSASHINAAYIERSNAVTARYLASLQRAYPALPHGSTVFFGGLAGAVAFQRGDGPLLRWAYRDTSLRSYYLDAFSRRTARHGPLYVFLASGDTLREMDRGSDLLTRVAFGLLLSEHPRGAADALEMALDHTPQDAQARYWLAWSRAALGDPAGARAQLAAAGYAAASAPFADREAVLARFAARDTAGALALADAAVRSHVDDPAAHGLFADLLLIADHRDPRGAVEAFAARTLASDDPFAWRRWATVQLDRDRPLEALHSLREYLRLGGADARADGEALAIVARLERTLPAESTPER